MVSRTFQITGELVSRVETDQRMVALTFDDGPTERTEEILQVLQEHDVPATFYFIGQDIETRPQDARAILEAGHELGNHSYSHQRMVLKSSAFVKSEIETTDALLRANGAEGEITFRPPYGKKLFALPMYLAKVGKTTVMWDVEPDSIEGVAGDADAIADYVLENVSPGSIVLLHAMHNQPDVEALPAIITGLREQGYEFVTVTELLAEHANESL